MERTNFHLPAGWQKIAARYAEPDLRQSLGQAASSILPYLALFALMVWSLRVSYWLALALAIPAAGFLVRIFIIFHDCGHGAFFRSPRANEALGVFTGILTFTPYHAWRRDHAIHHATAGDLDRRGVGDVETLTVAEYLAKPWWQRAAYRIMRFPPFMFGIGSTLMFVLIHRLPRPGLGRKERNSVLWTDLALLAILLLAALTIGWRAYVLVQLPIIFLASTVGVWLFYVQHQFDGVYWERHANWEFARAAIQGASYYHLPRFLQWFTGNIGFHHIHHLNPRIPNYNLPRCHAENEVFWQARSLTVWESLKSLRYRLWDEDARRLVGFRDIRRAQG